MSRTAYAFGNAELLVPSEWWLCLHYGAGSFLTIRWYCWVGHPARVVGWLVRRSPGRLRWRFRTAPPPLAIIAVESRICAESLALAT